MIGTLLIGLLGAGKEQYIVNQDKIPGLQGFWNDVTNLFINLSAYAAIAIIIALIGVLRKSSPENTGRFVDALSVSLFLLLAIFVVFQTAFPEYSNL